MSFLRWLLQGCEHQWELIVHDQFPSAIEQWHSVGHDTNEAGGWAFRKKSVVILKCTKCGKLNKTVTTFDPTKP